MVDKSCEELKLDNAPSGVKTHSKRVCFFMPENDITSQVATWGFYC